MKKIYYALAIALVAALNSCSADWLNVSSHDKIVIDEYYNTEGRIMEALVAAYDPMEWFDWNGSQYSPIPLIYEVMADDQYPGGADVNDNRQFHLMFDYASEPDVVCSSVWTIAYSGINRSNCVHQYMPSVQNISEESKALILAEATVLRTYYYTQIWKLWGNIPYYETNLEFPYICPQSSAAEVYEKLAKSLESVLEDSPLPMKRSTEIGRVTFATAAMLYAEIVMYQGDESRMQSALNYLDKVITSGEYSLASLADMWEPSGEWSSESIFEINYFSNGAYRSWSNTLLAGGTVLPRLIGINQLSGSSKYQNGWGFGPMTQSAVEAFEEGDLRKDVTLYSPSAEGASYSPRYQDTGWFLAKYLPRANGTEGQIADADLNFNNNIKIYRYAETLLYAAELCARGYTASRSAQSYLDEVRSRSGLAPVTANLDNILEERHIELMGEGKRYWDLIRTGNASSVLTPANDKGGYRTHSWSESKKYLPIPQSEIDAAQGSLTQNNY